MRELEDFRKYAEAVNAERYRVTCIRMDEDGSKKTFILDKKGGMTEVFPRTSWRLTCRKCCVSSGAEKISTTRRYRMIGITSSLTT